MIFFHKSELPSREVTERNMKLRDVATVSRESVQGVGLFGEKRERGRKWVGRWDRKKGASSRNDYGGRDTSLLFELENHTQGKEEEGSIRSVRKEEGGGTR